MQSLLRLMKNLTIDMIDKVRDTIKTQKMLSDGDFVLAAVSGGADSVSLLRLLCILKDEYSLTLAAAHINHGIRGDEALRDENFVKELCMDYGVPLYICHANVPFESKKTGESEEECGRRIRYEFLSEKAQGGKIATAHTLNDSLETIVFNLSRGSGLKGLCGIPPIRNNIIRPLSNCTREDVEEFCKNEGLSFMTDSTNIDDEYRRNFIRHNIIPRLNNLNPSLYSAVSRMIAQNRRDENFLETQTEIAIKEAALSEEKYSQ